LNSPPRSLRLGFAGTSGFAVAALDALARSRHAVCAVFTKADRPAGRGRAVHASPVKARALELGLEVHQPESFKSPPVHDLLRALDLDALIVVAYGLILPPDALAIPRFGCLNVHASLLPRWRGAAPIQRAILAADPVTGVTIMHMDAGLDTGPILAARAVDIAPADTAGTLHDRLAVQGGELLCETLDALALGRAVETPQPSNGVTYAEKIRKSEASIDWREEAATVLVKVRAFNPVPVAETRLDALQLRIWEAELAPGLSAQPAAGVAPGMVLGADPGGIDVACGRGVLRVLKLQLAGRKPLAAGEFIKAQRLVGARFTAA
jgi:methionyl-tRNA formyltransferase